MSEDTSVLFGFRSDRKMHESFRNAALASGMKPQQALRYAMAAMLEFYGQTGRIPRDMEIRQKKLVEPVATSVAAQQEVAV